MFIVLGKFPREAFYAWSLVFKKQNNYIQAQKPTTTFRIINLKNNLFSSVLQLFT